MAFDAFKDHALALAREHVALAEPLVFVLGFAESIAFVSLLVPSSALFIGIGGIHGAAGGSLATTALAGGLGAFLGDLVSYALGRYFKAEIGGIWPFTRNPEWYVASVAFFRRWGVLSVLGGKFLGFMRPFIPVVAGASAMPLPLFLAASLVSSLAWAGVFLAPGYGVAWLAR
jgi:membrane protein DedA with SNARE-associated domain